MSYYEPKFLRGVIEKVLPPKLFFRTRFFSDTITFPTETVSFEFAQDKRRLLPYSTNAQGSAPLRREGYALKTFTPPLNAGHRVITNDTLAQKMLGESEWNSGISPEERAAKTAAQDLMDLQDALFRKEEYMCARVKQDGKLETPTGIIDYGFTNIETVKNADKWAAGYDILGKLRSMAQSLRKAGVNPNMLIVGSDAATALMQNTGFKEYLKDYPRLIEPHTEIEDGMNYLCRITQPGLYLDVYEYTEYYYDDTSKGAMPLIDPGTVIMQSSGEKNYMLFGSVTYIKDRQQVSAIGEYVPYTAVSEIPPATYLVLASRSLPMPRDVESWSVLKSVV